MKKIFIMYDKGYKQITKKDYPINFNILKSLDLTVNTDVNKKGLLLNSRIIPTEMNGKKITLTELFLSEKDYINSIREIEAGEEPVVFIKSMNTAVMIRCKNLN